MDDKLFKELDANLKEAVQVLERRQCPVCGSAIRLTESGYFPPHRPTGSKKNAPKCSNSNKQYVAPFSESSPRPSPDWAIKQRNKK
jgi:hypothetical protein